jgi:capsular polysaccharide biosynthesis protein
MLYLLKLILTLWTKRYHFFLPLVFIPLGIMALYLSYTPAFTASTIISVDQNKANTALLRDLQHAESKDILNRRLRAPNLLMDTIRESGLNLNMDGLNKKDQTALLENFKKSIQLTIINEEMMRITYAAATKQEALKTLERLAFNFIDEILAPERFKAEQTLIALGEKFQHYSKLEKQRSQLLEASKKNANESDDSYLKRTVRMEFNTEKASAQKTLAREAYERLLEQTNELLASTTSTGLERTILKFEEPPVIVPSSLAQAEQYHILLLAIAIGLMVGLLIVLITYMLDDTLRTNEDIHSSLGLRVLGRLPNLGNVKINNGIVYKNNEKL